jgi:hypothetical protein
LGQSPQAIGLTAANLRKGTENKHCKQQETLHGTCNMVKFTPIISISDDPDPSPGPSEIYLKKPTRQT